MEDIENKVNEMADITALVYQENLANALEQFETVYHDFFIAGTKGDDYARLHNDLDVNDIIGCLLSEAYNTGKGEYSND